MMNGSVETVTLVNEERALLMLLAAKRDATYADIFRIGLYQLGAMEGIHAQVRQAVQARVAQLLREENAWDGIRIEDGSRSSHRENFRTGGIGMETDNAAHLPKQSSSRPRQSTRPAVGPERRVRCRRCHSGVLTLFMCGPRLRGRCQDCGTVWVYLWSCAKQGWFQWSN